MRPLFTSRPPGGTLPRRAALKGAAQVPLFHTEDRGNALRTWTFAPPGRLQRPRPDGNTPVARGEGLPGLAVARGAGGDGESRRRLRRDRRGLEIRPRPRHRRRPLRSAGRRRSSPLPGRAHPPARRIVPGDAGVGRAGGLHPRPWRLGRVRHSRLRRPPQRLRAAEGPPAAVDRAARRRQGGRPRQVRQHGGGGDSPPTCP